MKICFTLFILKIKQVKTVKQDTSSFKMTIIKTCISHGHEEMGTHLMCKFSCSFEYIVEMAKILNGQNR
jgi:hypothetical protein